MSNAKAIEFENRDYYIEIGLNIAFYRKRAGLTQEKLAEKVDISRSYLSSIETPNSIKSCSLELLIQIANALEVEPYRLLKVRE